MCFRCVRSVALSKQQSVEWNLKHFQPVGLWREARITSFKSFIRSVFRVSIGWNRNEVLQRFDLILIDRITTTTTNATSLVTLNYSILSSWALALRLLLSQLFCCTRNSQHLGGCKYSPPMVGAATARTRAINVLIAVTIIIAIIVNVGWREPHWSM